MDIQFPKFKNLELTDKEFIEFHTREFLPYSDYNFTSLWSWNIKGEIQFCELNGNLIIRFTDYLTREPFYSFLGKYSFEETVNQLLDFIRSQGMKPILRLLPEESIKHKQGRFLIQEDPDNFDYILSIPELITYKGRSLRGKRNFVNRFRKFYRSTTSEFDISDKKIQKSIQELFTIWAGQKGLEPREVENEFVALWRLLQTATNRSLVAVGIFVDNQLGGFSINEVVGASYSILHFEKADAVSFTGIYPYIMQETARELAARGCRFLNYEQDIGLPGLRKAKESYHPCQLLKKYTLKA